MNWSKVWILGLVVLIITGCKSAEKVAPAKKETNLSINLESVSLDEIQKNKGVIVVRNNMDLVMIAPTFNKMAKIYKLETKQLSLQGGLFEYAASPSQKYVVWFASNLGFVALDVTNQHSWVLEETNNYINQKPDFEFAANEDKVYWISEGGAILHEYDLVNKKESKISIPYPFGNAFKVSDDLSKIIYITGYSSQNDRPRFMYADRSGKLAKTFGSDAELNNRFNIVWTPDNLGTLLVRNGKVLFSGYENPEQTRVEFADAGNIRDIKRLGQEFYVLDDEGYWHKYDYYSKKELARIPMEVARELKRPAIYPWDDNQLLITENMREDKVKFLRLWISNYRGQKQLLLPNFSQVTDTGTEATLE